MALLPGGDLKARIRVHPDGMPPSEALKVTTAMARALDYAHGRGFVHRDVKPENILFAEDGVPQLTDFGIARAISSGTRMTATGMSIGSPHYMSPEQARGQAVDGRSDLYSLGVVLYEMLTGQVPFDAADTFAIGLSHINDPVPALPGRLSAWQPVVERLLAKSPEDRYGSAGELAEVLSSDAPPQAQATRLVQRPRDVDPARAKAPATPVASLPKPRRGLRAALAGCGLAVMAIGIVYIALQQGAVGPERQPFNGGGGSAAVQPAPVQTAPPSNPANPFDVNGPESASAPEVTPPLELSGVRAGTHDVELRHRDYDTVQLADQSFADGRVLRIEQALVRGTGAVTVMTQPREAWVERDGVRLAEGTPVTLDGFPAGSVELTLVAAEHRTVRTMVEVPKDGVGILERTLEPIPCRTLTLELEPPDATVSLPDVQQPYRPGVRLPEGIYRVVASRQGYHSAERTVELSGETRVRIELGPLAMTPAGGSFAEALSAGGEGPEMVVIPAGTFRMGCVSGRNCVDSERPVHEVTISRPFAVSKYEVTFADWERCVAGGGCGGYRPDDRGWGRGERPVINVSWQDVQRYVRWLSEQTRAEYRLLSEAEWEYTARAGSETAYSWGNAIGSNRANCDGCGSQWDDDNRTAPVGSFAANAFGLHDMHGNVWEWVEDCWNANYRGAPTDGRAWMSGDCERRVVRGGSWFYDPGSLRAAYRLRYSTGFRLDILGFRVARTLTP